MEIKNLILENTPVIPFTKTQTDPRILSRILKIDKGVIECWNHWVNIDGTWYYFKDFNLYYDPAKHFLNELIGEVLANLLELSTIQYNIGNVLTDDGKEKYVLLSKSFREHGYKYLLPEQVFDRNCINLRNLELIRENCKTNNKYRELVSQLLKMVVLDVYMNQEDRTVNNLLFKKRSRIITLAPLYDYEESFDEYDDDKPFTYKTPILGLNLNDINEINKFPELKELFSFFITLDIEDILDNVANKHKINIPESQRSQYRQHDAHMKKVLSRII